MYEYKMVQVPHDLAAKSGDVDRGAGANYMQKVVNEHAVDGWEFYRIDNLTVTENAGCLAGLFGNKGVMHSLNVVCFRRAKG